MASRIRRFTQGVQYIRMSVNREAPNVVVTDMASSATLPPSTSSEEVVSTHKKSTTPSGVPVSKIFGMVDAFPLEVGTSFTHWVSRKDLLGVQQELADCVLKDDANVDFEIKRFVSKNKDNVFKEINELYIPSKQATSDKHLVFVHGYGAGLGFFIKNLATIANKHSDWNIHAIDLPGYGCSSRPDFPHKIPFEDYDLVERLYTTPLREWFVDRGMNDSNTIVVAHSMGAYLLALLGINEVNSRNNLDDLNEKLPKSSFSLSRLFRKKVVEPELGFQNDKVSRKFWSTLIMVSPGGVYSDRTPSIPDWFVSLWNRNVSPFVAVRFAGIFGSKLTSAWTSRRFTLNILTPKEQEIMHRYSYAIFNAKGSGEYMLNYLLAPGAVPRYPLHERIGDLALASKRTLWLYGEKDWMNPKGGLLSVKELNKRGCDSEVKMVENAGHHIYLDNFHEFNNIITNEIKRVDK